MNRRKIFRLDSPSSPLHAMPRFIRIGRVEADHPWNKETHKHREHEWILVRRGELDFWIDGQKMTAREGDFYFLQPGQTHREKSRRHPLDFYALNFHLVDAEGRASELAPELTNVRTQFLRGAGQYLSGSFDRIFREVYRQEPGCDQIVEAVILQMLWEVRRFLNRGLTPASSRDASGRQRDLVEQAVLYMKLNINHTISLQELARFCCASPDHLRHVFKRVTGEAPHRYLLKLKMEQAERLLENEELCVYEIADRVGFGDPYHFSRQFKKQTGLSPTQFRRTRSRPAARNAGAAS